MLATAETTATATTVHECWECEHEIHDVPVYLRIGGVLRRFCDDCAAKYDDPTPSTFEEEGGCFQCGSPCDGDLCSVECARAFMSERG